MFFFRTKPKMLFKDKIPVLPSEFKIALLCYLHNCIWEQAKYISKDAIKLLTFASWFCKLRVAQKTRVDLINLMSYLIDCMKWYCKFMSYVWLTSYNKIWLTPNKCFRCYSTFCTFPSYLYFIWTSKIYQHTTTG